MEAKDIIPVFLPDGMYRTSYAQAALGWGVKGMRTARDNGLPVFYIHRTSVVMGEDLINYVKKHATTRPPTKGKGKSSAKATASMETGPPTRANEAGKRPAGNTGTETRNDGPRTASAPHAD
jgi:hypothetical protein